ncbi:MAG: DUF892 family protein, partial [Candidatus Sulfotelmatobacter sp.]
ENDHVSLLEQTLEEEKQTDQKLTDLAQQINPQAAQGEEENESEGEGERAGSRNSRNSSRSKRAA